MSEDKSDSANENFEELLEKSFSEIKKYEPGQRVKAEIVSISGDSIFLQLSGKSEGVLDKEELTDKNGELSVKEGDTIEAFFLYSKNGEMRFTTRISGDNAGQGMLENAFENRIPVEGLVQSERKGGFTVKIGDTQAFCPYSQMGEKRIDNPESYVGRNLTFKIIEFSNNGRNILVSNRAVLEEERKKQIDVLKKELKEGMTVKGLITSIQDFGAFVELDGIQGLLPISEISREHIDDINSVLSKGQEIEAEIIKLDWKTKRITLSMKALLADPWDSIRDKYVVGSTCKGTVVKVTHYGAFINLEPGLDGLLHVSEIQGNSSNSNINSLIKKGQTRMVQIDDIDTENRRISLKSVSAKEENTDYGKYMGNDSDTYNPFANFMKDKDKKK